MTLRNFAAIIGLGTSGGLFLMTFTPLATWWFHHLSGLSKELTSLAIPSSQWMTVLPGLTALLSFQRSLLVFFRKTTPITVATGLEVGGTAAALFVTIRCFDAAGAIAAAMGFVFGRLAANVYLFYPYFRILQSSQYLCETPRAKALSPD